MEITQVAIMLGKMIKESEVGQRLDKAKEEWANNEELRGAYTEYSAQHKLIEIQEAAGNPDPLLSERITARVNELFEKITSHPVYLALDAAQEEMNSLVQNVNGVIIEQITGTNPNCTHDCSTCGGCN